MADGNPLTHAIISGGSAGLGYAVAEHLQHLGVKTTILDINEAAGKAAVKSFGADNCLFINTNMVNEEAVTQAVAEASNTLGPLQLAVNCAGVVQSQRVIGKEENLSTTDFSTVIQINLIGTFNLCKAAANSMQNNLQDQDDQRGVIINTASIAAYEGQIGQAAYAASKGAIASLTLPLAREWAKLGIRVNCIAPGLFKTAIFEQLPEKARSALCEKMPFPTRPGKPKEFAALVHHIYENKMINGEIIRLDGALRM